MANCANYPLGLLPLNDLGTGTYNPTGNAPHQGGLYLTCPSDMLNDGVHTSVTGSAKLAAYLLGNMKADACCYPWYMGISLPDNELPSSPGITGTLGH